jgi:hypothetical protein
MFTIHHKGFPVECDTALEVLALIEAAGTTRPAAGSRARITTTKATTTPSSHMARAGAKKRRNAKARAAYKKKQEKQGTTTTSRLQALPSSKPTTVTKPRGDKRARTSQAVIETLKRSPSPLTLDEIDTDLEKSGWPYKGSDRKGAIRATLTRLKANGTVSVQKRGEGPDVIQMFRLERTNGETSTPVEQAIENGKDRFTTQEERDSKEADLAAEAEAADPESPGSQRDYL